ncbi:uncharacterized protein LOC129761891 [Toxorhynchites rutilus septentrionalis]|uniref:uncharacterized protein LOC129761891 n=1 Tax=Toxorhynchites rutilus septentrionalis TaxID=329112 RepID=UPI0024788161|nr:uncharacterized protein LOC129761891 [Toxorhynchites rutilus septentrionalis]
MGALKKMTQCGSISMLFAVLIVLFGVSSSALSTFGKSNTNQQAAATTRAPAKTKDCTNHADCLTIQNTSCVPAADGRLQCLCGDFEAPINGYCQAKYKGHRHICQNSMQCDIGMVCTFENITKTTTLVTSKTFMTSSMLNNTNTHKLCLCDKELGYEEDEHDFRRCSSAVALILSIPLLFLSFLPSIVREPLSYY